MAGADKRLDQVEREWLGKKITGGVTAQAPLEELRRKYFTQIVSGTGPQTKFGELELRWLRAEIIARGGTPTGKYRHILWRELVSAISKTPVTALGENKRLFFTYAA